MKRPGNAISLVLLVVAMLAVTASAVSCAPPGAPVARNTASGEATMTAIPLPTRVTSAPTEPPSPTATPWPTPTTSPSPRPTATPTDVPPVTPTATPSATPTTEPTATPRPQTQATRPQPTPKPKNAFDGKLVFQTVIGGDFYTANVGGGPLDLRRISDGVDPVWSPDGTQIAFTRWREPRGVWLVDVATGQERRMFDWSQARWPSWSPDGQEILFSRQHGGRQEEAERCFWGFCFDIPARPHWKLGIVGKDGSGFHEPPSADISLAPDWSPDGQQVVYDGEHGLLAQTMDGGVTYQITNDARDSGPVWSPDGSRVAFTRRQHDHWEVYTVDADGRNLARLTKTPARADGQLANSAAPAWSPDGKYLAFLSDRSGRWEIWVMAADGSGQKPMFGTALDGLTLEYSSVGERAIDWTR